MNAPGFQLSEQPAVFVVSLPGKWLLENSNPRWRAKDPLEGFQRVVNEKRAMAMARHVLDVGRSFPNAVILATDSTRIASDGAIVTLGDASPMLIVDGQHRVFAQHYSAVEATYPCIVHAGLPVEKMAELFLEINDTQKRVPASLRWDLVRLVRKGDEPTVRTADLVYELQTDKESPLFQRIDLTGEGVKPLLSQASVAAEIRKLVGRSRSAFAKAPMDDQFAVLCTYLSSLRDIDQDAWNNWDSPFLHNRHMRAALKLFGDLVDRLGDVDVTQVQIDYFDQHLERIDLESIKIEAVREYQGAAGIEEIYKMMAQQALKDES